MTTIDLYQRYPPHKDFTHHGKAPIELKDFNGKDPDLTMPTPDPSQSFDAKAKLLHDMLDRVVKDLANSRSESASEWDGTLWRSPLRPRSRSPAYSEISDSFESPGRIEHCTNNLLSTPMSPTSAKFRGPDGWPLGIEAAMNDFQRGRLSTSVLQERELPNPLILRKQKQQTPRFGRTGLQKGQETASYESVASEKNGDGQNQQESGGLQLLEFQREQSNVLSQRYGESQDHLDRASLESLASQQQGYTHYQQQSRYRPESVDLALHELQQQNDEETDLDSICIPTLSARKYRDDQNSLGNASSELHSALAHGKLPIGLGLENAGLELSTFQLYSEYSEDRDRSHTQIDGTLLLNKDSPQTAPNDSPPRNKETREDTDQAESRINAFSDALEEKPDSSKALGASEKTRVESIDREIGCHNTFEDSENNTLPGIGPLTSEDSKADTDSDIVSWRTLGPLEDILEESEDLFTSTLMLDQGQPQHFDPGSAETLDPQKSGRAGERRDKMLALQDPQAESSTLPSSPPRVPPTLKLTINPSSKRQIESSKPSSQRPIDAKSFKPIISPATVAELNDHNREKGRVSAAVLAEMRKTAKSQPHFQTGPDSSKDQSQAEIHPLLRSKSFSRPSSQSSKTVDDSPLKYIFEDRDSEGHGPEKGDSYSHQITMKPRSLFQPEAQDAESFITETSTKEHPSSQLGKMMKNTAPTYIGSDDDIEGHKAEYAGPLTPERSTLRSSNDTTLVPSLENGTPPSSFLPCTSLSTMSHLSASAVGSPDVMLSSTSRRSISSSTTGYYPSLAVGSPAAYNSWASSPHYHEHSNCSSTPSPAATLPTSTVPTPNTSFHSNSPTSRGTTMTASSSFGQFTGNLTASRGTTLTPSSSFGNFTDNKNRRSVSLSSMFARYQKARYPDLPTAAMTDSIFSSKESMERDQAREVTNDPFTSTRDTTTSGRFGLRRRSLSNSGRPSTNEGIERALSTMIFNPNRSRHHKRSRSTSAFVDTTANPDGSGPGYRRSLSIATSSVEQKWEMAPPPTPLGLRDEFSVRYRPEPLEADDHYSPRNDALQGMKQGLKKVFGRK